MSLSPPDWLEAQKLLLTLVQTVAPLAEGKEGRGERKWPSSFFSFPPAEPQGFDHTVSLLTTIHRDMSQWLERLPPDKAEEITLSAKTVPTEKKAAVPFSFQAQQFVTQVREAIGTLCTSSQIVEPKVELLRKTLHRFRPMLDELIEAISQEASRSTDHESDRHMRSPLPKPVREHLFKKLESLSKSIPVAEKPKSTERGEGDVKTKSLPERKPQLADEEKGSLVVAPRTETTPSPKPVIVSLSAAPYFPPTKTLLTARKKKKRKGFWLREEKNDPSNS